ncbi:uncharacterized protein [Montipora capricornis]|uniref:uncharacterized protein isoform X2 n=1 Tax=Montipora capricornis TaxID=246305 RepID=UPI0035F148E0
MSSQSLNTLTYELRRDYKVVVINILNDLEERQQSLLRYYYSYHDEDILRNPGNFLTSLERTGEISWTDVGSLKEFLRTFRMERLACRLEEYEMKRDLALLLNTYARKRQRLIQIQSCLPKYIEDVAGYLGKIADGVLDKTTVESLRKSKKNLQDLMNVLETKIDDKLSNSWSKLALLIVIVGEIIAEPETGSEEYGPKPEDLMSFAAEICSRLARQGTMEEFCHYVEEKFNDVFAEHDSNGNTISLQQDVSDAIDRFKQTPFFR